MYVNPVHMIMEVPRTCYAFCPTCDEDALHDVLKGKLGTKGDITLSATLKCTTCGHIQQKVIHEGKDVTIPLIISQGETSKRTSISLNPDEPIHRDDELLTEDGCIKVTALEVDMRRSYEALPRDISTIWAKAFDLVNVKLSIVTSKITRSDQMSAPPSKVFTPGDEVQVCGRKAVITKIKTPRGMVEKGDVEARDVIRIYTRPPKAQRRWRKPRY